MVASVILIIQITLLCLFPLINITNGQYRIMQGFQVGISELPYMASLRIKGLEHNSRIGAGMFCHATIIRNRVLLTSAYCIFDRNQEDILVVIGNTYLKGMSHTMKVLEISDWRSHGLYKYDGLPYDIAMIFTESDIEPVDGSVGYLPLSKDAIKPNTHCLLAGWGQSNPSTNQTWSNIPHAIWLRTVSKLDCYMYTREPGLICTKAEKNMGAVFGDIGGALVCDYKLYGISSQVESDSSLATFTEVRAYSKWIRAAMYLHFNGSRNGIMALRSICSQRPLILAISIYVATK
ncbi:PREDICTED: transmembrane protease serine 9-like isoform X1 [Drosophila arizonae]|uniref:Transmembrane protease serine 9-like isoform X1 n=1 Tax=Drosophila arizonae TaxID=7263 RepID=A0ABM1Q5W5_DROAR|nr:PREDICTED: transmembrane protease serine 9-like isoform X1 [Drosophila arizonae]